VSAQRVLPASAAWVAAGILVCGPANAMRCGQKVIGEGDHATRVLRFCGEPIAVETRVAPQIYVGPLPAQFFPAVYEGVRIEEWTYNFGPRRLMRTVTLVDGLVTDIRTLGYGFSTP
jgi:Protein of unknown function (DUF2845)